jgi:aminoglycoside phosphotransferase (APT) family kinase protein
VLPRRSLLDELEEIVRLGGPWLSNATFAAGVERLLPILRQFETPLVFTNGDYNVTNFLHKDDRLSGWLDFSHACFEDPHVGMGKFVVWAWDRGWASGRKAGLVERYLYEMNLSRSQYAPRLAVRCLHLLQTDCSPTAEEDARYRTFALAQVTECMQLLGCSGP